MNRILQFGTKLFLLIGFFASAQDVVWTGNASNNDFFDEGNWKDAVTNIIPGNGTIDPGVAINLPLKIDNVTITIVANGVLTFGTGSLSLDKAKLTAQSLSGGSIVVNEGGYLELTSTTPFITTLPKPQINFTSGIGWIKTPNYSVRTVSITNLSQIKVNGSNSSYKNNLRLDNYYLKGCIIRANLPATTPLMIYDAINSQGTSASITVNTLHSNNAIANSLNNKIESFILKKGFMATFATEADGTGKSKNYIASEDDLVINAFPKALLNSVSFIRVMPWNWVTKKGRTDSTIDLNTTWRYQWDNAQASGVYWEYAPMSWGHGGADDASDIALYNAKYNSTHVMSFNEPDDCNGQSGQYPSGPDELKLCNTDIAVGLHKNLMKTGMRLVSPGGREEAPFGWLKEFYNKATAQDIRIDVIAVHWYDWGSNPSVNTNPTALQVFNRFKAYLTNVHNLYGLPIWITEFNANPARNQTINAGFMALALPYLETLDYIERYNWFPFNTGTDFYSPLGSTTLSQVGLTYRDINTTTPTSSTPSIPEATVNANNNLNVADYPNVALNKLATSSSVYSTYVPSKAVDGNIVTSISKWIVNFGEPADANFTPMSSTVPAWLEVDLQGSYTIDAIRIIEETKALKNFKFEIWDTSLNSGAGGWANALTVTNNPATPLTTYKTFTAVTTTKVRLSISAHNSIDYLKLFELEVYGVAAATLGVQKFEKQDFTIYPNPVIDGRLNIIGKQEIQSVDVYNISGAKINTPFENGTLMVNDLATGVYFLRVNKKYSIKFIKN